MQKFEVKSGFKTALSHWLKFREPFIYICQYQIAILDSNVEPTELQSVICHYGIKMHFYSKRNLKNK